MDEFKTDVIFKKTKNNEIIAFFPYESATMYNILSYMHIGQHSEASTMFYNECKKAYPEEYKELYNELQNIIGYNLNIKQKVNYKRLAERTV